MKPKGINFLEQHVEKIVIGVAGVIVIAIAGKSFFTDPNAVRLAGSPRSPSAVDEVLADKARSLKAKMDGSTSLDVETPGRLTDWLEQQYQGPRRVQAPTIALVAPVAYKVGADGAGFINTATEMYAEVNAPAPVNLQAATLSYTIDPAEVQAQPDLAARFGKEPPYDLHAVHVTAEFDGTALRSSLSGFVDGRKPIPGQWVDQDLAIIDIVVERQHLLSDGSWSGSEVVETIPGQLSVRDKFESASAASRLKDELLSEVVSYGPSLYQPGFYTLADGTPWSFDLVKRSVPKSPEVLDAEKRMRLAWREVERAQEKLDRYLKVKEGSSTQPTGDEHGGKGGKGGGMEGGQTPADDPSKETTRPRETREQRERRILDEGIAKARAAYDAAKKVLSELDPEYIGFPDAVAPPTGTGGTEGGGEKRGTPPPVSDEHNVGGGGMEGGGMEGGGTEGGKYMPLASTSRGAGQSQAAKGLFENPALRVWWHDIGAKTGTTYRYRLAVGLYNPFFGRESRLTESQQQLAASPIVLSAWSAWSEPIRVTPPQQFFAVTGIYNDQIDDRSASFEVYCFTRGEHRVIAVTCRPGEPIGERKTLPATQPGGESQEVDFFTGATLLDVVQRDGGSALNQRVQIIVAMPDGSIQMFDPGDPRQEEERQRLRSLAGRV